MSGYFNLPDSTIYPDSSQDRAEKKRMIYEMMGVRGRKFVDRIGYENWDPFQPPKEPSDFRIEGNRQATDELVSRFALSRSDNMPSSPEYMAGVREGCWGVINDVERFQGIYDFCKWYWEARKG